MLFGDRIFIPRVKERRRHRQKADAPARGPFLTKRRKFVAVSFVLSLALFGIQAISVEMRYYAIAGFAAISYLLTAWSMHKDLRGIQWLSNMILPTLYPASIALFYFLLPQEFVVRVGIIVIYAITMYALLLTTNIYGVASIRTIQLLRAARAVGFLLTILTSAFLFHVIFALRLPALSVGILVFLSSWLLFYQGIWTHTLSITGEKREFVYTMLGAMILLQASLALTFWLIDVPLASIMLSMIVYVLLGIFQQDIEQRLFARTIQEYTGFAGIVFVVIVVTVILKWMN
jgi:hypothetical protein